MKKKELILRSIRSRKRREVEKVPKSMQCWIYISKRRRDRESASEVTREMFALVWRVRKLNETSLKGEQAVRAENEWCQAKKWNEQWSEICNTSCELISSQNPHLLLSSNRNRSLNPMELGWSYSHVVNPLTGWHSDWMFLSPLNRPIPNSLVKSSNKVALNSVL